MCQWTSGGDDHIKRYSYTRGRIRGKRVLQFTTIPLLFMISGDH